MLGELELAWRLLPNRFVAVTGTNGKTTVTELLGHVWRTAGEPVAVAGNVGTPLASLVGEVGRRGDGRLRVLELSARGHRGVRAGVRGAAQRRPRPPRSPRRLRRATCDAKLRIFANQGNDDVAVFNASEQALRGVDLGGCARRVAYCRGADPDCRGRAQPSGVIFAGGEPLLEADELSLLGPHNADNAMAAAAAALAMGLDRDAVREGLRTFAGVAAPARARRRDRTACSTSTTRRRPTSGPPRRPRSLVRRRGAGDPRRLAEGRRTSRGWSSR